MKSAYYQFGILNISATATLVAVFTVATALLDFISYSLVTTDDIIAIRTAI